MSVWFRQRQRPVDGEKRSAWWPPFVTSGGSSYADVDLRWSESSLQKVAVWAAVDLVCSLVSELPIDVFEGEGSTAKQVATPRNLLDPSLDGQGVEDWISQALISWLLRGNMVGTVLAFGKDGNPAAVELKHPDRTSVADDGQGMVRWYSDRGEIPPARVFHRRVYPVPGELLGMSPIQHQATTIGLGIAINRFGKQWFTDGAHPGGLLVNSEADMSNKKQADIAKERFLAGFRGSREPVVLGKGWEYKQVQIAPEESQFLESNQFTSAECARIFGPGLAEVLGYESGGSMTYSNVESRSRDLLKYSLNRWIRRMDRVLSSLLPPGQYVRLNRDALLESTTLERFKVHELALRNRIRNVNEVRQIEDLPPAPWGSEPNQASGGNQQQQSSGSGEDNEQ